MYRLLPSVAVFFTLYASGQGVVRTDTASAYERIEVVQMDSTKTADDLYRAAKHWFVDAFKDAKEVVQMDDPTTHTIIGKGNWTFASEIFVGSAVRRGTMWFTVEIVAKDGRYRVRFYDYRHAGTATSATYAGSYRSPAAAAYDMGTIYADPTYCSHFFNNKNRPDYTPTKHECRICLEEVWPQIKGHEVALLESIKDAMNRAGSTLAPSGKGASDW